MFNATDLAAAAVVIDSIVTIGVGRKLIKTAEKETAKAAETVTPVIKEYLGEAFASLLPIALDFLNKQKKEEHSVYTGSITPIDKRTADKP